MNLLAVLILVASSLAAAERVVSWSPDKAELSWVSSTDGKTKYVINFRTRLMTANGKEPKRFSESEQFAMMRLFLAMESYTLESEDWHVDPEKFMREREGKQVEKDAEKQRQMAAR